MIQCTALSKAYGSKILLEDSRFSIARGERIGLIGRNGSGKSTIFKLLLGEELPDQGEISIPRGYTIGHLAQHLHFTQPNIVQEVCLGLPEEQREEQYRAEILLAGLGFSQAEMELPASRFSGGFQIRVELARVLISKPDLLLLDEPTNYLDITSARWLTRALSRWEGELIVISHDRDFLDHVTTHTMIIHRQKIRKIEGDTSKLYEDIALQEQVYEQTRLNEERKRKEVEVFINRFRAKATKAAAVQSRIKALERLGTKEALQQEASLEFSFSECAEFHGKSLLEVEQLSFGYSPNSPLIRELSLRVIPGDRIAVIGQNGRGKSTLLRLLSGELTPTTGRIRPHTHTRAGYFGQTNVARLSAAHTVEQEIGSANDKLSRTALRAICGAMMFGGDDALKKISVLSGGERSRVLLGKIIAQASNLLFLDEPTNHLDMHSIEALLESLTAYHGGVVIVTHSESILRQIANKLVVFQGDTPFLFEGSYDDFLERIGWDTERDSSSYSDPGAPSKSRARRNASTGQAQDPAAPRRSRAELIAERSRTIKPLERSVQKLEERICSLEARIAAHNQALIAASEQGNGPQITELSRAITSAQREIETSFDELSTVSRQLDERRRHFDTLLDAGPS